MVVTIDCRQRKVDWRLGLGIFIFPFYFAWRLLGPGYSQRARVIGFGWMIWMFLPLGGDILAALEAPNTPPPAPHVVASSASLPNHPPVKVPAHNTVSSGSQSASVSSDEDSSDTGESEEQINADRIRYCIQHPNSFGHSFMCSDVPDPPQAVIVVVPPDDDSGDPD